MRELEQGDDGGDIDNLSGMPAERAIFARDRTVERADVLVDGTGATPPVLRP